MADSADDWSTWFRRHGPAMLLLARQWTHTTADAEDVVQDAFLRFWRSRHRAEDPGAYLYACVRHSASDLRRGRLRRTTRERLAASPESTPGWFATDDAAPAEERERAARIDHHLNALPREQREIVVLKVWGRLSFAQVATALAISPNTAASRYRYALEKLRSELAEERVCHDE
jgi:RNA polymerase sigma-70 factor (ECF subfamily)